MEYAPWRETRFEAGQELALLGNEEDVMKFTSAYNLILQEQIYPFTSLHDQDWAGFAEVIIPPRSELVGQTMRQFALRQGYAVEPLMLFSKGEEMRSDFSDHQILSGDTIIVYGLWENISDLKASADFVVATPFEVRKKDQSKVWVASLCFLGAIVLALAGAPISLAFFTGAIAMVLARVLTIQEAYQAIEWKVVFLLAGL
ncbi:MAG: SLC13 family permease, partial [Thermodesulfobacteriota bacterium]